MNLLIGGIQTVKFSAEIDLLASICYYIPALISNRASLGQSFCGMTLHKVVLDMNGVSKLRPINFQNASTPIPKATDSALSPLQNAINSIKSKVGNIDQTLLLAAFLQSILPYLYARRSTIWSSITDTVDMLFSPEIPSDIVERDNCEDDEIIDDQQSHHGPSVFTMILNAFVRSIKSIATETELRLERISGFFWDINLCLFFMYGQYLEIPLRLTNLQPFTKGPPKMNLKLKLLAWLMAFRLTCFIYYGTRVMCSELDKEMMSVVDKGEIGDREQTVDAEDLRGPVISHQVELSCAVCLDTVKCPSALPCGHICCWDCIMPYAVMVKNRQDGNGGGDSKECRCPVCRNEFLPQEIRALYY
jgi:hypothetical protein